MKKKEVKATTEEKTVDCCVDWQLSEQELEELKKEHLNNLDTIDELTVKKKRSNDDYKIQIKQLQSDNYKLRAKIKSGIEQRTMPCKIVFDYDKGIKTTYHPQTGEVIKEQVLTDNDRQMELKQ